MSYRIIIEAANLAFDSNGHLIKDGTWSFYDAVTLAPKAVYDSADLSTSLGNVITSSGGFFPELWASDTASYRVEWRNASGALIHTFEDIRGSNNVLVAADIADALGYTPMQNLKDATGTPSTSNPHAQYKNNSQLGFYFGTTNYVACVGGIGTVYFNPTSFEVYPNGTDKRFSISDTSLQLHYDNIAKGVGDGSVKPPNFTWKLPDAANGGIGNNGGSDWALVSLTANHNTVNIECGYGAPAGVKTAIPFRIYTADNVYSSIMRLEVTAGIVRALFNVKNSDIAIDNVKVLGARQTGFSAWTGTATKSAKATSTATLADVAERLKAIDDALRAHGIID